MHDVCDSAEYVYDWRRLRARQVWSVTWTWSDDALESSRCGQVAVRIRKFQGDSKAEPEAGSSVSPVLRRVLFVYWKDTILLNNHWTHYINWLILINFKSFSLLVTSYIFYIDLVALEVGDLPTASEKALVEQGSTGWNRGSTWVHPSSFQANSDDSTRASDSEASVDVGVGPSWNVSQISLASRFIHRFTSFFSIFGH